MANSGDDAMRSGIGLVDAELAEPLRRADDTTLPRSLIQVIDENSHGNTLRAVAKPTRGQCTFGQGAARVIEAGSVNRKPNSLRAFTKARAAAAVGFAFERDSLTAASQGLYEAHHAIRDLSALRAAVNAAIG